ncbi:YwmB family TATA-box binding protein [Falsibacillus pallidus]|uniref:TATA-box binding protein n=1 Tax=Falsibacillus pallidus TaxID=493781 RepID=A0A370GD36_9BACI|nr:YwmB family TATA-box binding protein [Falsibacillus pallidus]RDI41607.1 TATA-box binding protein [Falsibacillus pallidus]
MNKKIKKFSIGLISIVLIGFIFFLLGNTTTNAAKQGADLWQMAEAIEHENGQVIEWSLYTRETLNMKDEEQFRSKLVELKRKFPKWNWKQPNGENRFAAVGTNPSAVDSALQEKIQLISTLKNGHRYSYVIYEVSGQTWSSHIAESIKESFPERLALIYKEKPAIFSCIKGEFNDKMDNVLLLKAGKLLKDLHAEEKESLKEKDFYSVSAYSPDFTQAVPLKNSQMNVQIGLRKNGMGAKTTVVIGTPIITIEY